jgi:transcription initiation factor TFIIIB Brf1 subunit/transcription initiation factor TFIIB
MQACYHDFSLPLNNNNLFELTDAKDIECGDASYAFALFEDGEFDDMEDTPEMSCENEWRTCEDCNTRMRPMKNSYKCEECGIDEKVYENKNEFSISIIDNYNSSEQCSQSIKIVGKDSYRYKKALWKTSSDYKKVQSNTTNRQLSRFNAQSRVGRLPIIILKEAADLYKQVQKYNIVCRGKGRVGALGACIGFVCDIHDISKKPKEIAAFLDIDESYLSKGDKLLRSLHAEGKIDIPIYHNPKNAYLIQYFEALDIDEKYKPFVSDLIDRASQTDMRGENNSRISTQCAGAVYALKILENLSFKKADIVRYCKISKSTFIRYHDFLLKNRKTLNLICEEHNITPMKKNKKKKRDRKNILNMKSSVISELV